MTPDRCQRVTLNGPLCGGALGRDQYGDLACCLCGWVYVPEVIVEHHKATARRYMRRRYVSRQATGA